MLSQREQKLLEAMEPQAEQNGVEIVSVEVMGSKKSPTVRVYIDADGGISFDELASAQMWINQIMDDIDPFPGAYTLEVSSPGIDRPLRTLEHFSRFVGETAVIKTIEPIGGKSSFTGTIDDVVDGSVVLEIEGIGVTVPLANMKRAHLKGQIVFNK